MALRKRPTRAISQLTTAFLLLLSACSAAQAQRIQIPAGSAPSTFAPSPNAPAWGGPSVQPSVAPSAGGAFGPSVVGPGVSTPGTAFGSPITAPPPAFDPYSVGPGVSAPFTAPSTINPGSAAPIYGAPPLGAAPYDAPAYTPSPLAPAYSPTAPAPSAGLYSEGSPLGWQPGTYGFQNADGGQVRFRQLLARLRFEHTLLLGDNSVDSFELNRTEIAATFAFPVAGSIESPLLVTPGFAFNWFDGPIADPTVMPFLGDMPSKAYDAYLDFSWFPRFNPQLGAELGVRTGVWTDFNEVDEDTVRVLGRGLGVLTVSPEFDFLIGVVYLDRLRVKLLPAGGIRWRPSPEWDLYLVFPNPKIRRQLTSAAGAKWWWYVGGEYGGGSWTLNRANIGDRVDYNDLRIYTGLEWETPGQARGHLEIGYAFDREIIYESGMPASRDLDDAVMFRAGIGY